MELSKKTTITIKGVAIIFMIAAHILNIFPIESHFYTIPFFNTGLSLEIIIGRTSDICVYIFAFISGYGLFYSFYKRGVKAIVIHQSIKIIAFLLCYWLVLFVIYSPFYIVYQGKNFRFGELVKTMFGHHGFYSYGWYIYYYLLLLITLPIISKLLNINKWLSIFISYIPFIGTYLILSKYQSNILYYDIVCVLLFAYSTACIGYSFAKYNFLHTINELFKGKRWLIMLVSGVVGFSLQLVVFGYYGKGVIQPFTVVPITIFLIELFSFDIPKWIRKPLDILGKNSMNMWYIHYMFFAPYITCYIYSDQWILFSKVGVVAVILGVIISLIISLPFTYIDNKFIKKITFINR